MGEQWRVGRKVGRTIYRQLGAEPSDNDHLIGVMDTRSLAAEVIDNRSLAHKLEAAEKENAVLREALEWIAYPKRKPSYARFDLPHEIADEALCAIRSSSPTGGEDG